MAAAPAPLHDVVEVLPTAFDAHYAWRYESAADGLRDLYEKAKREQWNASTHLRWDTPVDPESEIIPQALNPLADWGPYKKLSPREEARFRHANLAWTLAPNATNSDALRGGLNAFPVGPGGGEELCFPNIAGTVLTDSAVPAAGSGYWYLLRGRNACAGAGTYGNQGLNGSPGALRVSTTCP